MTFPMVPHMHGWYNRNVRNNSSKRHSKFLFWELTVTVCGEKELQTHSRNHVYFQLSLPFLKNVKELGETLIFGLSKNTKTPKLLFNLIFHDVNTSGVDYAETCVGGHSSL